jgi:hypothetical protein
LYTVVFSFARFGQVAPGPGVCTEWALLLLLLLLHDDDGRGDDCCWAGLGS